MGLFLEPLREGDQITESDLQSARRLVPYNNHFALRTLLDKLVEGAADELGLPERESRKRN